MLVARFLGAWQLARAAALLLAVTSGTTLPDVDQLLPLLDHRDALTHSVLPALVLLAWPRVCAVVVGLALGLALHLAADCFPEAMVGYATVELPFFGTLGGWSYLWLGGNAVAGAVLFGRTLRALRVNETLHVTMLAVCAVIGGNYLFWVDGGWWALASLLLIGWGVGKIRTA